MQNRKSFLIAFAVGVVLFGIFAALIPGLFFGEDEIPANPDDLTQTENKEDEINGDPDKENQQETQDPDEVQSFTAIVGGYDENNGELDALLFIKADAKNERFVIASIPTYLSVPLTGVDPVNENSMTTYTRIKDFPEVFSGKEFKKMLVDTVRAVTGMKVDYYAFFNTSDLMSVFEKTGGIYYTVPQDMYYQGIGTKDNPEINVSSGGQVLTGRGALGVLRFASYTNNEQRNESLRAKTQADFISEALKQLVKIDSAKLIKGASDLLSSCETNFTAKDFAEHLELILCFNKYSSASVVMSLDISDPIDYSHSQKLFENYK